MGAGGAARAVGAEAATIGATASKVAMVAAPTFAGLQSAGLTYADEFASATDRGLPAEEAEKLASKKATVAGINTGIITGLFSAFGRGGIETEIAKLGTKPTVGQVTAAIERAGGDPKQVTKSFFTNIASKMPIRYGVAKGAVDESLEEMTDELSSAFLLADPGAPIYKAFENAWDAGKVGAVMGAVGGVQAGRRENQIQKLKEADLAARNKSLEAETREELPEVEEPVDLSVDQRKPGDVTEQWESDDGRTVGLRYEEDGVTPVTKDEDGNWIESGNKSNIGAARRSLFKDGFSPARGVNRAGEEIEFTEDERYKQRYLMAADLKERQAAWDKRNDDRFNAMMGRLSQKEQEANGALTDRLNKERNDDRAAQNTRSQLDEDAAREFEANARALQNAMLQRAAVDPGAPVEPQGTRTQGAVIDPEVYPEGSEERAAAQFLVDNQIATTEQAVALANSRALKDARGDLVQNLTDSLRTVFKAQETQGLPGVLVEGGPVESASRENPPAQTIPDVGTPGAPPIQPQQTETENNGSQEISTSETSETSDENSGQESSPTLQEGQPAASEEEVTVDNIETDNDRDAALIKGRTIGQITDDRDSEAIFAAARMKRREQALIEGFIESRKARLERAEAEQVKIDAELKKANKKKSDAEKKQKAAAAKDDYFEASKAQLEVKQIERDIRELNDRSKTNDVERAKQDLADTEEYAKSAGEVADFFERDAENLKNGLDEFGDPLPETKAATPKLVNKARDKFIEQVDGDITNLAGGKTLRTRAAAALRAGWITQQDHDEVLREAKAAEDSAKVENKGKPREDREDPDFGDAWSALTSSLEGAAETPAANPVATPAAKPAPAKYEGDPAGDTARAEFIKNAKSVDPVAKAEAALAAGYISEFDLGEVKRTRALDIKLSQDYLNTALKEQLIDDREAWSKNNGIAAVPKVAEEQTIESRKDTVAGMIDDALVDQEINRIQHGELHTLLERATSTQQVDAVIKSLNQLTSEIVEFDDDGFDPDGVYGVPVEDRIPSQTPASITTKVVQQLVKDLSRRANIRITWATDMAADVNGEFNPRTREVRLNANNIRQTAETPLHEIAHAIIAAIRSASPRVYLKLASEMNNLIDTDPALRRIRDSVIDHYGNNISESLILDEMMARYLGIHGADAFSKLVDTAKPETKNWAARAWQAITRFFKETFRGRLAVRDLSERTTLGDIVTMMTDPSVMFDFNPNESNSQSLRVTAYDYGSGMVISSRALLDSINEGGASVAWVPTSEGPRLRVITGTNGKQDVQSIIDMGDALIRNATNAQWSRLSSALLNSPTEGLGEDFWKGHEDARAAISPYLKNPTATQLRTIIHNVVGGNASWKLAMKGSLPVEDYERVNLTTAINTVNQLRLGRNHAIRTTITRIPGNMQSTLTNTIRSETPWLADLADTDPGAVFQLNPEQISQLRDTLQKRIDNGNIIKGDAMNETLSDAEVASVTGTLMMNEQAATERALEHYKKNPFEKLGITKEQAVSNSYPGELAGQVAHISRKMASPKPTLLGKIGDGTRDGLYNATPDTPAYSVPEGKLVPKADGSPQSGFKTEENARSFRTAVTAREGLDSPMALKVIRTSKGGVVTYWVVCPPPFGHAKTKAVLNSYVPVNSDPFALKRLPTFSESLQYLKDAGHNWRKVISIANKGVRKGIPEGWWLSTRGAIDQESIGEKLDPLLQLMQSQNVFGNGVAWNAETQLNAKFGNVLSIDQQFGSPTYGHATGIKVRPGDSPFAEDIMTKLMTNPTAYPLTPQQKDYVDTIRSLQEQMRQLMRDGKLDKDFLNEMGIDMGEFLNDPTKGQGTPRAWMPRFVLGHINDDGEFVEREYSGLGSTATEKKGFDKTRMTDENGKWLTREQIANGTPSQKALVYSEDINKNMAGFIRIAYSALAASQLRENLDAGGYIIGEGSAAKSTLQTRYAQGIPILNDAMFELDTAQYLENKLVRNQQLPEAVEKVIVASMVSKTIALGGADIAAPATVALVATLPQLLSSPGALIQNWMTGLTDLFRKAETDPKAFNEMCLEIAPGLTEMIALGGKVGSQLDYQQTISSVELATRINNSPLGADTALSKTKAYLSGYIGRLSDFHSNFVVTSKVQIWNAIRPRFIDPATGQLATDPDSIDRMKREVLAIDRAFGHSVDQDISLDSRWKKGALSIIFTAPAMYSSMFNNLLTKEGMKHVGKFAGAGVLLYYAAALCAGMPEREIRRRLDPRKSGFMTIDIDMGSAGKMKFGLSHFYKSLMVAASKTYDNADRIMNGEVLTSGEIVAPVVNLGRSRVSPFSSGIWSLFTNEDYMGNRITKGAAVLSAISPISLTEPIAVGVDRALGVTWLATADQNHSFSERASLQQTMASFAFNTLGFNAYTENIRQEVSARKDALAIERFGVPFRQIPNLKDAAEIADKVASDVGSIPKFRNNVNVAEWRQVETDRFVKTMDPETRRWVQASGADTLLRPTSGIKTKSGNYVSLEGLNRDNNNRKAIELAQPALAPIFKRIRDGADPVKEQAAIAKALNDAVNAGNSNLLKAQGVK
jgi:hypothetical protein